MKGDRDFFMLFKVLGAALTLGACGFYGLTGARRMENRVHQLKSIRFALSILEREITYVHNPLPRALEKTASLADAGIRRLFTKTLECLNQRCGYTAEEAWNQGVEELRQGSDLAPEDLALLGSFASRLGVSDVDEQRRAFQLLTEEIKVLESKASETAASGKKLWSYGGFLLGALIVLLLV